MNPIPAIADLPIAAVLGDVERALADAGTAVLVAPPGAGKTTGVPLALRTAPWLKGRKILLLEPRRLAARGAAARMAALLDEEVGQTVGLRARLGTRVGPATRIEVVTEGVFTRMILDDPSLQDVGCVLFDEFHERSLASDTGLAFALESRQALREDLRLLVMSATLDTAPVARLLADAPLILSEGRSFHVTTTYLGRDTRRGIDEQMAQAILRALRAEPGSVLAFLPGQSEIRRTEQRLADALAGLPEVDLVSLYGALDLKAQDRAIAPAPPGRRKVVLSTAIAETSLTIEGVRVVVDSGLARVPRYEPDAGITRLETVRVSRAAADQRRGRAGRTEPGVCFRLWDEPETASLKPFSEPEIRSADLAPLLLDCAAWGASDPTALPWLDSPPAAALAAARDELERLGALTPDGRLTPAGRELNTLALPPRLAHMVLEGGRSNALHAAGLAAVIVEKGLGGRSVDIDARHEGFLRDRSQRAAAMRRLAQDWARSARGNGAARSSGALLALAYPDRIAKARGADGQYLLANGRGARMDAAETLAREPFLVVAEMTGAAAATRILTAARLDESELAAVAGDRIVERDDIRFDTAAGALRAERVRCLDAIVLSREPQPVPRTGEAAALLAAGAAAAGIERLPWTAAQRQLRARVAYLRQADPALPDLSDPGLAATVGDWLAPHLAGKTRIADIPADTLAAALAALIPWDLVRRLDREAPTHFEAPTGNRHPIDYEGADAPSVAVRVQELFGLTQHPVLARGGPPLTLHLLSPAHRPLQITRDLPGFWRGSWRDVRADMRGRYPKHDWPEDPAAARPTTRAKPRSR